MTSPEKAPPGELRALALATGLTGVAGYVDAVGFLRLGHLFVSFMSGNSTQFAVALDHDAPPEAALSGGIVALFLVGVVAGRLVGRVAGRWRRPAVLLIEAGLLALAAASAKSFFPILAMIVAMGMQNAVIHHAAGTKTGLTYVTGTLVSLGEAFADALLRVEPYSACAPPLCLWLGLAAGAVAGAAAFAALRIAALALPAASLLALALATALRA